MSYLRETKEEPKVIRMRDMKPLQVGRITDSTSSYNGCVVMRTADKRNFEVINLSSMEPSDCWVDVCDIGVVLLKKGETLELVLCNE